MAITPSRIDLDALSPMSWVLEERRRQTEARGEQNHSPYKWMMVLSEEMGEIAKVIEYGHEGKLSHAEYLRELEYELIQTAAVAVAFVEAIRRNKHTASDPTCTCADCPGVTAPGQEGAAV